MSTSLAVPLLTDSQRQEIGDSRSQYSPEDRIAIAMAYVVEGGKSTKAAEKATHSIGQEVKSATIRQWVSRAPWWPEAITISRQMLQQDLDNKYTRLIRKTESELLDRLENGNSQVVNGELIKVPVAARDLMTVHAIAVDKQAMLRGNPTSRKEVTGVDLIMALAAQLQKQGESQATQFSAIEAEFEEIDND